MYVQDNSEIREKPCPVSIQNGTHRFIAKYGTILSFKGRLAALLTIAEGTKLLLPFGTTKRQLELSV